MITRCNNCLDDIQLEPDSIQTTTIDDLDIQFFACPSCGKKYVVFAANKEMKKLVAAREQLQRKIRVARAKKFREKTIRKLIDEQSRQEREQKKLIIVLNACAEKLLAEPLDKEEP